MRRKSTLLVPEAKGRGSEKPRLTLYPLPQPLHSPPPPRPGPRMSGAGPDARPKMTTRRRQASLLQMVGCLVAKACPNSLRPHRLVAHQALLSMGFSRQEYWRVLPWPPPGIFLPQGSNLHLLRLRTGKAGSLPLSHLVQW